MPQWCRSDWTLPVVNDNPVPVVRPCLLSIAAIMLSA